MEQKILVIEDDESTCRIIQSVLNKKFKLIFVDTVRSALECLNTEPVDLILLDVELPDESGFHFCARLRNDEKFKDIQIIFVTGKTSLTDKILGFSVGADDYITKPFELTELQARVDSKMRRISERQELHQVLQKGFFEIDFPKQKIRILASPLNIIDLPLTTIEFKLLSYFITHEDHVLSREQIINQVWGMNVHVIDRTVDSHIYTLRQKLGVYSAFIKSVKNSGYCFSQGQEIKVPKAA